mmetsp:Transcript_138973/g.443766  ORF Transcript_138973/g.443766 Transcript_138973/m.443766 type:complete len:250 (-) Transcript_138973:631-1380(-)
MVVRCPLHVPVDVLRHHGQTLRAVCAQGPGRGRATHGAQRLVRGADAVQAHLRVATARDEVVGVGPEKIGLQVAVASELMQRVGRSAQVPHQEAVVHPPRVGDSLCVSRGGDLVLVVRPPADHADGGAGPHLGATGVGAVHPRVHDAQDLILGRHGEHGLDLRVKSAREHLLHADLEVQGLSRRGAGDVVDAGVALVLRDQKAHAISKRLGVDVEDLPAVMLLRPQVRLQGAGDLAAERGTRTTTVAVA